MESDLPTYRPEATPLSVRAVWLAALRAADRAIASAAAVHALPAAELKRARARLAADREWFASAGLA
jgi:hypothetical protein